MAFLFNCKCQNVSDLTVCGKSCDGVLESRQRGRAAPEDFNHVGKPDALPGFQWTHFNGNLHKAVPNREPNAEVACPRSPATISPRNVLQKEPAASKIADSGSRKIHPRIVMGPRLRLSSELELAVDEQFWRKHLGTRQGAQEHKQEHDQEHGQLPQFQQRSQVPWLEPQLQKQHHLQTLHEQEQEQVQEDQVQVRQHHQQLQQCEAISDQIDIVLQQQERWSRQELAQQPSPSSLSHRLLDSVLLHQGPSQACSKEQGKDRPCITEEQGIVKNLSKGSPLEQRSLLRNQLPFWSNADAQDCGFFFFETGTFMQQRAPNGQTWSDLCAPAHAKGVAGSVSGPWAECMHAAVVFENSHPKWKDDPNFANASPTQQVLEYFEACGHSDDRTALERYRQDTRKRLSSSGASGISSNRCSSRATSPGASLASSRMSSRQHASRELL